jgi:pilus assembly protein CpaE
LNLLAAPADAVEGAEVSEEILSRVLSLARRTYDYVIVDTFPVFDRVVMAMLDQTDQVYVVLENVVPTLLGIEKFLKLLQSIGYPVEKQRVVINRYSSRQGSLPVADAAERLNRDVDLVIPYDRAIVSAANLGRPFISGWHPLSGAARSLHKLVAEIERRGVATSGHSLAVQPPALPQDQPQFDDEISLVENTSQP